MQYMLLVYADEKKWFGASQAERDRVFEECDVYGQEMIKNGQFLGGAPLEASATATTIRHAANGGCVVTDGPFAETKEVLAGYHLVECKDQAEAIALAKRFPGLGAGLTIEVRALMER